MAKTFTFASRLAEAMGMTQKDTSKLIESLAATMRKTLCEGETIAIPGFGEFAAVKTDEHVDNLADGRRMLMPPSIHIDFTPATALKKRLQ